MRHAHSVASTLMLLKRLTISRRALICAIRLLAASLRWLSLEMPLAASNVSDKKKASKIVEVVIDSTLVVNVKLLILYLFNLYNV